GCEGGGGGARGGGWVRWGWEGPEGGGRPAGIGRPRRRFERGGRARRPSPSRLTSSRHPSPPPVRSWLRGGGSNRRPSHFSRWHGRSPLGPTPRHFQIVPL